MKHRILTALLAAAVAALAQPASAQTKWNLPAAYPADNPHSVNLIQFAKEVGDATGGKLQITVHPAASLFKAPDIKRAVQTGQVQIGEVLISLHENEDPIFGVDVVPFLATSFAESRKLWEASKPYIAKKLASQSMMLLFAVPWAPQGVYAKKDINAVDDMKGLKWRAYNVGTARIGELVGAQVVTVQAAELAGAGDRRRQLVHHISGDGIRQQGLGVGRSFLRHAGLDSEKHHLREQGSIRRARQADAGCGAQGLRRRGRARLEDVAGKERLVSRSTEVARDEGAAAEPGIESGPEEDRRSAHCGLVEESGCRRRGRAGGV
jgi:hypothetical protein